MKKFFTLLLGVTLFAIPGFSEDENPTVELKLIIDDIEHVVIDFYGEEVTGLKSGENTLTINPWTNVGINAKEGYTLVSVVNAAGTPLSITDKKSCSAFIGEENETLTITTASTASINFTVNVDDATLVKAFDSQFNEIALTTGSNSLSLSSTLLPIGITSSEYQPFYKVTLDGVEVPYNYGYSITPVEGSVIDVQTKYPDVDFNVTFEYADAANSDFFCAVYVDENPVDFKDGFSAKAGSKITLYYNTSLWYNTQEDSDHPLLINLNGKEFEWFGSGSSFILASNTVVEVAEASRKETITVEFTVNSISSVVVYSGTEYDHDVVALQPGQNTITLGESDARIVVETAGDEYKILYAMVNDSDVDVEYYNHLEITGLKQGDKIEVRTNGADDAGIATVAADENLSGVYNLMGVKILDNATDSRINSLPAGIYIINGKKQIRK